MTKKSNLQNMQDVADKFLSEKLPDNFEFMSQSDRLTFIAKYKKVSMSNNYVHRNLIGACRDNIVRFIK